MGLYSALMDYVHGVYPLVICNVANWKPWPIEIVDLPMMGYTSSLPWRYPLVDIQRTMENHNL
jgi:hypothetical protein